MRLGGLEHPQHPLALPLDDRHTTGPATYQPISIGSIGRDPTKSGRLYSAGVIRRSSYAFLATEKLLAPWEPLTHIFVFISAQWQRRNMNFIMASAYLVGATNREGGSSKPVDLSVTSLLAVVVARMTWPERSKSPENLVYVQGTCESAQSI